MNARERGWQRTTGSHFLCPWLSSPLAADRFPRSYGALMWSLGKVTGTPEVKRVYISSFFDREFQVRDVTSTPRSQKATAERVKTVRPDPNRRRSSRTNRAPPLRLLRTKTTPTCLPRSATTC